MEIVRKNYEGTEFGHAMQSVRVVPQRRMFVRGHKQTQTYTRPRKCAKKQSQFPQE